MDDPMQLVATPLSNAHLTLEPMTEAHREALRVVASDPDIWELSSMRGDGVYFDIWFDHLMAEQAKRNSISHVVVVKGKAIGHSAYLVITPQFSRVEIGWTWYQKDMRGTKVNPACKHLLLGHAFACGAERVELKTHHKNLHSQNAMLKMGAKKEGILRRHAKIWDGSYRDTVFFSVLQGEWPLVKAGLEKRL
ncbi:Acetyltransferase, GNAT family [hydrothermal vent metagenome]|uniref:Acetyltransferase, GNAT family n=1 Tax=hydrothermal vent metagenome TaxID=652676 RepID=A0A3B0RE68_9ZZZZ